MSATAEKPCTRKRGRPPLTKEYANPLQSPMAQTSMQMQKQGLAAQNFAKPLMKVGQMTPSPKKRRSNGHTPGAKDASSLYNAGFTATSSRKGRYRGVVISTPSKKNESSPAKGSVTPSSTPNTDSIFSSTSRAHALQSSPPMPTSPIMENFKSAPLQFPSPCRLSFNIGVNGRASISRLEEPTDSSLADASPIGMDRSKAMSLLNKMRSNVSKSMAQNNSPLKARTVFNPTLSSKSADLPTILETTTTPTPGPRLIKPDPTSMSRTGLAGSSPLPPTTPKANLQYKLCSTPTVALDQVLLAANKTDRNHNDTHFFNSTTFVMSPKNKIATCKSPKSLQQQQQQQQQDFVFKFCSADPLLLTDDADGNWPEIIHNQWLLASPKRQGCFNTPPSWVNFGSPRVMGSPRGDSADIESTLSGDTMKTDVESKLLNDKLHKLCSSPMRNVTSGKASAFFSPELRTTHRRSSITITSATTTNALKGTTATTMIGTFITEPTTPKVQESSPPAAIECTPLIQQTMNGSLNTRFFSNTILPIGTVSGLQTNEMTFISSSTVEQDDARLALKKLVNNN